MFDFTQARSSQQSARAEAFASPAAVGAAQLYAAETPGVDGPRELPDVLVTLGLFVVPVGATIMQGPAIVASLLGR